MGDPGIDTIKLHGCTFDALLRIVGTEDFEETAFFWKALVSRNDTEDWTAFLAFLTETDDNCHDTVTGMGSGFGEVHGGDFEEEIKRFFPLILGQGHASTSLSTCPWTSVSLRSMPLL